MKLSKIVVILYMILGISLIAADATPTASIPYENIVRIVLMGKTGAGKSTIVNAFYNFSKKTKWDDFPKWFPIQTEYQKCNVEEYKGRSVESHSRGQLSAVTQEPSEYMAKSHNYAMSIIDCPGAADPRGLNKDIENTKVIANFMAKVGDFNAIGIVLKGTMNRETAEEKYFIEQVKTIIPKSAHDRIFIIVSHGTTKSENVESFVKSVGLPLGNIFYFDNFALSKDGYLKVGSQDLQGDDSDEDVGDPSTTSNVGRNDNNRRDIAKKVKETWIKSHKEFNKLYTKAQSLGRFTSDDMTKISKLKNSVTQKILEAYGKVESVSQCEKSLETARNGFQRALDAYENSLLNKTSAEGSFKLAQAEQQAASALRTSETYDVREECRTYPKHNTICGKCRFACHENCGLDNKGPDVTDHLIGCHCMSNGTCTVCPNKCGYTYHRHDFYVWKTVTKTREFDSNKKRQLNASSNYNTMSNHLSSKQQDLDSKTQEKDLKNGILSEFSMRLDALRQEKDCLQHQIVDLYVELGDVSMSSINFHIGEYYDTCLRTETDTIKIDRLNRERKFYMEQVELYRQKRSSGNT